jgi:hypothetical protein
MIPATDDYEIEWKPTIGSPVVEENVTRDVHQYSFDRYPRPDSQWDLSERERFKALLSEEKYDVIVVPFQVQGSALDRATRSYMAIYLAEEIRRRSEYTVADPQIVARALGDGQRRISSSSVYELARAVGARMIVWGHVAKGYGPDLEVTFQFKVRSGTSPIDETMQANVYKPRPSRKEHRSRLSQHRNSIIHPIEEYPLAVSSFMPHLPIDLQDRSSKANDLDPNEPILARTATAMIGNDRSSVQAIYDLHLLASLTPKYADRVRERFAEKSMLALQFLSDEGPEYRVLKARTLMLFGVRPAALKALGEPRTIEEKYYYQYLHGNLPAASELSARITSTQARLIANLEVAAMAVLYGTDTQAQVEGRIASLELPGSDWELLVKRAMSDLDTWIQFDNLELKQLLDSWFPLERPGIEPLVTGAITMGGAEKASFLIDFSVHEHIRRLVDGNKKRFCCAKHLSHPSELDLLDLVEAMAIGNLARRIELRTGYQGLPDRSISDLDRLAAVYEGHPLFTMLRARAEFDASREAQGAAKEKMEESAYRNAQNAYFWSRGQTHVSVAAREILVSLHRRGYESLTDVYGQDYPFRAYYAKFDGGGFYRGTDYSDYALNNSAIHTYPVRQLRDAFRYDNVKGKRKLNELLASIEGRFDGSIEVALIRTEAALDEGDISAAKKGYREVLATKPQQWEPYGGLAELLFEDGEVEEAASIAMSYPGFAPDSGRHPVELSNYAYGIGSRFFWAGYFTESRALYKIAADLQIGSNASITSALRLQVLDRNLMAALGGAYRRAVRYNSSHAYRDYLGMLHAMGYSEDAWNAFNVLVQEMQAPHPWETALVGHRISATSEPDLIAWARQGVLGNKGRFGNYAANYLLRATTMDRLPSQAITHALADIDEQVWLVGGRTYRKTSHRLGAQSAYVFVGPSSDDVDISTPALPVSDDTKKVRAISELVYFAKAYKALREHKFERAEQAFNNASRLYGIQGASYSYMLPYMAFAASKSGNMKRTLEIMNRVGPSGKGFDYLLARAVLTGLSGETDQSVRLLRQARHRRPHTEMRPIFTEYQYAEVSEWLYEETGAIEYRDIALEWARLCQKNQPWHAWPNDRSRG